MFRLLHFQVIFAKLKKLKDIKAIKKCDVCVIHVHVALMLPMLNPNGGKKCNPASVNKKINKLIMIRAIFYCDNPYLSILAAVHTPGGSGPFLDGYTHDPQRLFLVE